MAKVTMLNMAGEAVGDIEPKDEIFGIEINEFAVHEVKIGRASCRERV